MTPTPHTKGAYDWHYSCERLTLPKTVLADGAADGMLLPSVRISAGSGAASQQEILPKTM